MSTAPEPRPAGPFTDPRPDCPECEGKGVWLVVPSAPPEGVIADFVNRHFAVKVTPFIEAKKGFVAICPCRFPVPRLDLRYPKT